MQIVGSDNSICLGPFPSSELRGFRSSLQVLSFHGIHAKADILSEKPRERLQQIPRQGVVAVLEKKHYDCESHREVNARLSVAVSVCAHRIEFATTKQHHPVT